MTRRDFTPAVSRDTGEKHGRRRLRGDTCPAERRRPSDLRARSTGSVTRCRRGAPCGSDACTRRSVRLRRQRCSPVDRCAAPLFRLPRHQEPGRWRSMRRAGRGTRRWLALPSTQVAASWMPQGHQRSRPAVPTRCPTQGRQRRPGAQARRMCRQPHGHPAGRRARRSRGSPGCPGSSGPHPAVQLRFAAGLARRSPPTRR